MDSKLAELINSGGSLEDIVEQSEQFMAHNVVMPPVKRLARPVPDTSQDTNSLPAMALPIGLMHPDRPAPVPSLPSQLRFPSPNMYIPTIEPPREMAPVVSRAQMRGVSPEEGSVKQSYAMQGTMKPGTPCGSCPLDVLSPVCGSDGKTYPSACWAQCMHIEVSHRGNCLSPHLMNGMTLPTGDMSDDSDVPAAAPDAASAASDGAVEMLDDFNFSPPPSSHTGTAVRSSQGAPQNGGGAAGTNFCDCPIEFAPVCAEGQVTHPSRCYARCANAVVVREGACEIFGAEQRAVQSRAPPQQPKTIQSSTVVEEANSGHMLDQMCACDLLEMDVMCGEDEKTYNSRCWAKCAGVQVAYPGECHK